MADENFQGNQSQWPKEKPALGTGEGESPFGAPSSPKIDLRTMASDQASMKEMGGMEPRPYTPPPFPADKPAEMPKPDSNFGQMLEKNVINPPSSPSSPSTPLPPPPIPADLTKIKSKKKKSPFALIIVLVVVIGAAALGYFVVYPNFIKKPVVTPVVVIPPPAPPPAQAICGNGACEASENTASCPADCPAPPTPPPSTHSPFFKTPADATANITLAELNAAGLKQAVSFETGATPTLKEIIFKNSSGDPITFKDFAAAISPNVFNEATTGSFDTDATFFLSTNSKGTWPGIVLKLKSGVSAASAQSDISKKISENKSEAANLYLQDPGTSSDWKTGSVLGKTSQYLSFSLSGAALSYTWFDNYLLVSTNYDGAKEAAKRLGF